VQLLPKASGKLRPSIRDDCLQNITHIQAMGIKGMATVGGDRPDIAESDKSTQELSLSDCGR
jgi:hypothetical protein